MTRFRLTSPRLNENDIERACLDLLAVRHWKAYRLHSGMARFPDGKWFPLNPKGTADYACLHARYPAFLLETKRPQGKFAEAQAFMAAEIWQGYHIPTVKASTPRELADWLDKHEAGSV